MFDVVIHDEFTELPKSNVVYIIAENGLFKRVNSGFFETIVPCKVESLQSQADALKNGSPKINLPKIPQKMIWQIKDFFAKVVEKYHAESIVMICFSREEGKFKIRVPNQKVNYGGIVYDRDFRNEGTEFAGYEQIGTIHSHCDFNAFHSGTDDADEVTFNGFHITFGHNDRDVFSITSSLMSGEHRFVLDSLAIMDGIKESNSGFFELVDAPSTEEWSAESDNWMEKVSG